MPLVLDRETRHGEGVGRERLGAALLCDHCRDRLHPEAGGRAVWQVDPTVPYQPVDFVHHSCAAGWDEKQPRETAGMELDAFLEALLHNLR